MSAPFVTIRVTPMGKPRMTQRDRWKKRPAVLRYHAFKDTFRAEIRKLPHLKTALESGAVCDLSWIAYLPMPKSWSMKKRAEMRGQLHRAKPDRDNIDKAILDALFADDSGIASGRLEKRWDDGKGERLEISIELLAPQPPHGSLPKKSSSPSLPQPELFQGNLKKWQETG